MERNYDVFKTAEEKKAVYDVLKSNINKLGLKMVEVNEKELQKMAPGMANYTAVAFYSEKDGHKAEGMIYDKTNVAWPLYGIEVCSMMRDVERISGNAIYGDAAHNDMPPKGAVAAAFKNAEKALSKDSGRGK